MIPFILIFSIVTNCRGVNAIKKTVPKCGGQKPLRAFTRTLKNRRVFDFLPLAK